MLLILAFAVTVPMVAGTIDLSIGYGLGLWQVMGLDCRVSVLLCLLGGAVVGLANALLVGLAQVDASAFDALSRWSVGPGGLDPTEQAATIKTATAAGLPVVGWNAGILTGPGNGMTTNVSTEPLKVAQIAAAYAVADSEGKAGVVLFTDGQHELTVTKARAMEAYVKAVPGCTGGSRSTRRTGPWPRRSRPGPSPHRG